MAVVAGERSRRLILEKGTAEIDKLVREVHLKKIIYFGVWLARAERGGWRLEWVVVGGEGERRHRREK